ncbi:MAG: cysteine synthase A [Ruminococcaceae bacterium]|nr:cysteine synthase A [Oscillospiraceae bacterium]
MNKIYDDISQLIGNTPLFKLNKIKRALSLDSEIYAKLEYLNPTGSVKDRAARQMLDAAMEMGLISPGGTVIEPTSGNTGIGLAAIAASRGMKAIIVMPDSMSRERIALMEAYGASVVLTEGRLGMKGAIEKAEELNRTIPCSFIPSQFDNIENKRAHFLTTGPEIYDALADSIDIFVATVGTGGTLSGTAEYLRSKKPDIRIIAVEPSESPLLSGGIAAPHKIQGIGANFIPKVLNRDIYDEVITVSADEAYESARLLGRTEGIAVGISSGAALAAATHVAKRESGKRIVTLFPDGVDRYLSTDLF